MDCFVPASNQSAVLTDTRHCSCTLGGWEETNEKLPRYEVFRNLLVLSHSHALFSHIPACNTSNSNEVVQYHSTELGDCHPNSIQINIFLVLLEEGNLIKWKQVRGILLDACQRCPISNYPIQNSDRMSFVDRDLKQCITTVMQTRFMQINNMLKFLLRQNSI